ncbi:2,3-diaminopropionate biosynthesis protein SbnA [Rheinheimera sp. 4Y26]|uniref:2,3-diaminopropionate biosynthesis protein SbnA n=1 Tax=Rheinheimera sp. 4Y26 TaxID=2977811 RepID=UPI0021B0DA24|nr:2,3-diaminopropionate biosynthesis protein SbnA [Rheinheimera sp. 4Y26]MCT6700352.1 2,3-diaminopropionate biosynthesis protein SbnA [Rheinheimera sp. 4Y26]
MIFDTLAEVNCDEIFLQLHDFLPRSQCYVKLENLNLAGSVKLKAAVAMIDALEAEGRLMPGGEIVESSSGNLGVALAMVCAERGYKFTCVTDPNASPKNIAHMRAYGADIIVVEQFSSGGFVKERLKIVSALLAHNPAMIWTDQYSNKHNAQIHFQTTASSIHKNIPDIDYLFLGLGSSGTFMGCAQYFAQHKPDVKIIAVDPDGSILFGPQAKPRYVPGIGGSVRPALLDPDMAFDSVTVTEADTLAMCRQQAKQRGWLIGGSTGTVLAGIQQYQAKIAAGSKVVMLAADYGGNYLETIYNDDWAGMVTAKSLQSQQEKQTAQSPAGHVVV